MTAFMLANMEILRDMPRGELLALWETLSSQAPPNRTSTPFLARLIAYEAQAQKYGDLGKRLQSTLERIAAGDPPPEAAKIATQGTRLVREWNDIQHSVDVTADGVIYRGKTFRSLSAVAREITGARWSGPRFFGLQRKQT